MEIEEQDYNRDSVSRSDCFFFDEICTKSKQKLKKILSNLYCFANYHILCLGSLHYAI